MNKETIKTIVIVLLSMVFVFHSIEKKNIVDDLKEDNSFLQHKVELADSLMLDTTLYALNMAARLTIYEEKVKEFEDNKHKVTVTMYHPVAEQTDDTPNITADGSVIKVNNASDYRYVAVSRNMLVNYGGFLTYGDYVFVDAGVKSGVYQVRDTMAPRWLNRIDILETPGVKPYKYNDASLRRLDYVSENL
jgi:3D (Asp-Asp-Asp) domain-containing protein